MMVKVLTNFVLLIVVLQLMAMVINFFMFSGALG